MGRRAEATQTPAPAAERVRQLLDWYAQNGRAWPWRATRDRWHVLVSEVCLQQTQAERAAGHVTRLLERYPTPADMAIAPLAEVLSLWQGLGYPRRARNLHRAAAVIASEGWPARYEDLPGVGPYTAAALRCFADELPVVPPDINTRRVAARLFPEGLPTHESMPVLAAHAWAWGQALMELGQRACRARAVCEQCPVVHLCPSRGTEEVIASARQAPYAGSMRQRRGSLLRALTSAGRVAVETDAQAAHSLVADGLAALDADGMLTLPPAGS